MLDVNIEAIIASMGKVQDLRFDSFVIAAGPEGEGNKVGINLKSGLRGMLELQVIGGGPVFLFEGSLTAKECFHLVNSEVETRPHYLLAACVGQCSWRNLTNTDQQMTAYSDAASVGHIRLLGCPDA